MFCLVYSWWCVMDELLETTEVNIMSALYALDYCAAPSVLSKNSEDFSAIKQFKLRIPTRDDWKVARQAGVLTEQCMRNMEHGVVGFILGVACDAAVEDLEEAARLMIAQERVLQSHLAQQAEVKDKLWVYLTNIKSIVNIVKRYFPV